MFRTIKWVIGGIGFLLFLVWEIFLQPIWNINVERWAEAKGIDHTVDSASQRVDSFVMPQWLVDSVEFLTGDFLLGFVAASLVFLFLDLCVLLRRKFFGGRKSHESSLQSQNAVLTGNDWAKGLIELTIQDAACAFANISRGSFADSDRTKRIERELVSLTERGWIATVEDIDAMRGSGGSHIWVHEQPNHPVKNNVSGDTMISTSMLKVLLKDRAYDFSWLG